MAVSPYYDIKNEYRVIVLDKKIKIIYLKERPYVKGDGKKTIAELIIESLDTEKINFDCNYLNDDYKRVLDEGELYYLSWKHNLGKGAKAIIIKDKIIEKKIKDITMKVIDNLNIVFASVDIAEINETFKVVEINSGVMMEHFSQQNHNCYNIAKKIYREAILKMFE